MDEHQCYQRLFDSYAEATDGKAQIATAVVEYLRSRGLRTVVDIGAGNGVLARLLANSGVSVLAVEPNRAFAAAWRKPQPPNLRFVAGRGQDLPARYGGFDAALLAYVLDSMPPVELVEMCARLTRAVRPFGAIIGVTYAEDSAWRRYSASVEAAAGPCLVGGETRVFSALRSIGVRPEPIRRLHTTIEAGSLEGLFNHLAFFYRRVHQGYQTSRDQLTPELARHATGDAAGRWSIQVSEVLFTMAHGNHHT